MATSEIWVRQRVPQRQIADWIKKKVVKISRKTAKKGFRPFAPENYIMSFIILMQSGFLYRGHWVVQFIFVISFIYF